MRSKQILLLQAKVNLGVMAMKKFFPLPRNEKYTLLTFLRENIRIEDSKEEVCSFNWSFDKIVKRWFWCFRRPQIPHCWSRSEVLNLFNPSATNFNFRQSRVVILKGQEKYYINKVTIIIYSYLPTPPLSQDMTQGQFLSGVKQVWIQSFPPRRVSSPRLKNSVRPTIYPLLEGE